LKSDPHQTIYTKLLDITERLNKAIDSGDVKIMDTLAKEHDIVMKHLKLLGLSNNVSLRPFLQEVQQKVVIVLHKLEKQRNQVKNKLLDINSRKKMIQGYTG
jgi:hypothetical protein